MIYSVDIGQLFRGKYVKLNMKNGRNFQLFITPNV